MISVKNILVPTDFSETSAVALKYGKALAEAFDASLHLIHVIQPTNFAFPTMDAYVPTGYWEAIEKGARLELEQTLPEVERKRYKAQLMLLTGSVFMEIEKYVENHKIDLIILGTHGHGPLVRMLMGNVADKVVRKAACPVLVVRPDEHQFVTP